VLMQRSSRLPQERFSLGSAAAICYLRCTRLLAWEPSTAIRCTDQFDVSQKGVLVAALLEGHWTFASRQRATWLALLMGGGGSPYFGTRPWG
jgi:hypothetical protein